MKSGYRAEGFGEELELCGWGRLPWGCGLNALYRTVQVWRGSCLGGAKIWLWESKALDWVPFPWASWPRLMSQLLKSSLLGAVSVALETT